MESKLCAIAFIILAVAGLSNCTAVDRELRKINFRINNMQQNMNQKITDLEFENRELRQELDGLKLNAASSSSSSTITDNGSKDSTIREELQKIEGVVNLLVKDVEDLKSRPYESSNQFEVSVRKAFVEEKVRLRKLNETLRSKQELAMKEVHDFIAKSNASLVRHIEDTTRKTEETTLEMTTKLDNVITTMISQNERFLMTVSDCGSHKNIPNGHVSGDSFVGGTPVISCNSGYSQTGSAQCKIPVAWETDIKCQKDCAILHVANGMVTPATSVPHGTPVTVTCDSGYVVVGNNTAVCNNGDFTAVPSCGFSFIVCGILHVTNGMVTPATSVSHGATVTVTCDRGYVVVGNNTPVCNNGDFTGIPSCNRGFSFTDMVVGSKSSVNIKADDDNDTPLIYGAEFLSDGRLILCDYNYNNKRIKLLSSDFSVIDSLKVESQPFDVSAVNSTTVIITIPGSKLLQYVHVLPQFSLSSRIQLDKKCWGVDVAGDEIFTSCHNSWGAYKGEVMVFDLGGILKRRFGVNQDNSYMFQSPAYLTVSSNTGYIYVSDYSTDKITCLSSTGDVIYQYDDPELIWPRSIIVDDADNTIVLGRSSHNAHVITASGKKHRIVLTASDGVHHPYSVAYRQSDATLVIGSRHNTNLLVFKLKY